MRGRFAVACGALGMALVAIPAFAHGGPGGHGAAVRGTISSVGNGTIQVQTSTGTVTLRVSSSTHVTKDVTGRVSDLAANQHVDLQLVSGTTSVSEIEIEGTKPAGTGPKPTKTRSPGTAPRPVKTRTPGTTAKPVKTHTPNATPHPITHVGGVVVSVTSKSITLHGPRGTQTTYTFGSGMKVIKETSATTSALAIGKKIAAFQNAQGAALSITILS